MNKLALAAMVAGVLGVQAIPAAPPVPDIQGKILEVMLHMGSSGSKTAVRIYFSSISGNDRWRCNTNPGYVEFTDDHANVSTGRLDQMLSMALAAYASGSTFAVDFAGGPDTVTTCKQGTFAYIMR